MWRNRILRSLAPMVLSPLIKLSCFNFMTSPRAILEKPTQELITMAISILFTPCPRRPATAIISVRPGSPWKMLEIVVMTPSIQPPKYPAKSPRAKPSSMESTVAASARRMINKSTRPVFAFTVRRGSFNFLMIPPPLPHGSLDPARCRSDQSGYLSAHRCIRRTERRPAPHSSLSTARPR